MSACRSCGALIEWAVTEAGRRMPVDAEPTNDGTILLRHLEHGKPPVAHVTSAEERAKLLHEHAVSGRLPLLLFVSHFATCPNAAAHRRAPATPTRETVA